MADFEPGYCELLEFEISSIVGDWEVGDYFRKGGKQDTRRRAVDIRHLVTSFSITESMSKASLRGSASITDSVGILEQLPILGEEALKIVYKDSQGNVQRDWMFIYAVQNIVPSKNGNAKTFNISFTSLDKFTSGTHLVRKAYDGSSSDIVKMLFNEYYNNTKQLVVGPKQTNDYQLYVIPGLDPEQAIHFASRRAYSAVDRTQSFRFFESRRSFIFATDEYLSVDHTPRPIRLTYRPSTDLDPSHLGWLNQIKTISIPRYTNTYKELHGGSHNTTDRMIDIATRFAIQRNYKYPQQYRQYQSLDNIPMMKHSTEFTNQYLNRPGHIRDTYLSGTTLQSDWDSLIRNHKTAYWNHLSENTVTISIYGRNDIAAGDVVYLDIDKWDGRTGQKAETHLSGNYFVYDLVTIYDGQNLEQKITLAKPDWRYQ